jgi:2-methylcitrate dehydratase
VAEIGSPPSQDQTLAAIVEYALGVKRGDVAKGAADTLVRRHLDAVGTALGGMEGEPCRLARQLAETATGHPGTSVIGLAERSTPEYATFANAAMIRYLDLNDTYHTEGGGHPSDLIPALWSIAEARGSTGAEVITAMHVAYEVFAAVGDAVPLRDRGVDYGLNVAISTAAGAGNLAGLTPEQLANAISIAITPNVPLSVARSGELSHWKALASPYAAMAALFAVRLAESGVTGPPRPFDGVNGLFQRATGEFRVPSIGQPRDGMSAAERTHVKLFPSDYETQAPAAAFIRLHREGVKPDDVDSIQIRTYYVAWHLVGGGQDDHDQKWDPKRRETADHSIPYVVAVALTDGRVNRESFSPERIADPALRPLMNSITIAEDPEITKTWTSDPAHEIEVRLKSGQVRSFRASRAPGHALNPVSDEQLTTKFIENAAGALSQDGVRLLLDNLWRLDSLPKLEGLMEKLRMAGR